MFEEGEMRYWVICIGFMGLWYLSLDSAGRAVFALTVRYFVGDGI